MWKLTNIIADNAKTLAKTIVNPDSVKKEDSKKTSDSAKPEKKEEKK